MTELFVGVIVVALVGNAAENSTAIIMARRNRMDVSMAIATGASTQIALFVAPVLVFLSVAIGHPMTLVFNGFEIAAIVLSVMIVDMISSDGETNWFEGAQLLAVYAIVAVAFYFVPGVARFSPSTSIGLQAPSAKQWTAGALACVKFYL